jgi:hypothetical protein
MLGLFIGAIYFVYGAYFGGAATPEVAFLQASHFLYVWYWVTCSIGAACAVGFILLISLGLIGTGAAAGHGAGGLVGALVGVGAGAAVGGLISVLAVVRIVFRSAFLIGGAFLMMSSGTSAMDLQEFDTLRLVIGGAMVLSGLIFFRARKSSSNSGGGSGSSVSRSRSGSSR